MKRIQKLLTYALPALVAVSCTNIDENIEPNGGIEGGANGIALTLKAEATRTTLGTDGKSVAWAESDKVGLFADYVVGEEATVLGANAEYAYKAAGEKGASFSGDLRYGEEVADSYNFYAYYPYTEGTVAHDAVAGTLPAEQNYDASAENFDLSKVDFTWGKTLGVAKSGEISIEMKHAFALMQFTLTNSLATDITINSVTIEAEGQTLAGDFTADLSDGTITFGTPAEAIEVVTENLTIAAGENGVVRFMMNAVDLSEKDVTITIAYNTSEKFTESFTGRNFAAAGNYNKNITIGEAAPQTDWYVKSAGEGDGSSWEQATTLDNALLKAAAGSTIHVAAGTYVPATYAQGATESDANKTFEITKNVTLIGGYPANATTGAIAEAATNATILDGNATSYHVVLVTAVPAEGEKVTIEGITIQNGNSTTADDFDDEAYTTGCFLSSVNANYIEDRAGTGLYVASSNVYANNCQVIGNNGKQGAGVYAKDATLTINGSTISGNISAGNGGGVWLWQGELTITDSVIKDNGSTEDSGVGRGLYVYADAEKSATAVVKNTTISGNLTTANAAGVYVRGGDSTATVEATFTGCTISGNQGAQGGGMYVLNATATLDDCDVINNIGTSAAGIYATNSTLNIKNGSTISGNTNSSKGNGAGVWLWNGELNVSDSYVENNGTTTDAGFGHGLYVYAAANQSATATVKNTTIKGNLSNSNATGVTVRGAAATSTVNATFEGCTISGNQGLVGSGIWSNYATATFTKCTISENEGTDGAGVNATYSTLTFDGCTISENNSTSDKGVFFIDYDTNVNILNSTFNDNISKGTLGVIYVLNSTNTNTLYVANTVFEGNSSAGRGGVAYVRQNKATFVNCTFKGNSSKSNGSVLTLNGDDATANIISCTATANNATATSANGGCFATETTGATLNLYNTIVSGNITSGTSDANVHNKAGTINYKNVVVGEKVYDADGEVVEGSTFATTTDLGTYANGVYPVSESSVAWTSGMSAADLYTLGSGINSTLFTEEVMKADQKGNSRTGNVMGAYVGK